MFKLLIYGIDFKMQFHWTLTATLIQVIQVLYT